MKTIVKFVLFASVLIAGRSCTALPLDKETSRFVGVWTVSSDNPEAKFSYWVFYDDGSAKSIKAAGSDAGLFTWEMRGIGKWSYDENTKILATTVNHFQVQTTMIGEKEWTAIGPDGKYHYTGTWVDESDLTRLYVLLMGTEWKGDKYGSFSIGAPLDGESSMLSNTYGYSGTALKCSMPAGIQETATRKWTHLNISQNTNTGKKEFRLLIQEYSKNLRRYILELSGIDVDGFELSNPLSPSSCRLVLKVSFTIEKIDGFARKKTYEDTYEFAFLD
jgi:hypothetical protein